MKKNLWIIAITIVAIAAVMLGVWQALGLGTAGDAIVAAGAMGWLALGFGALAVTDPFSSRRA